MNAAAAESAVASVFVGVCVQDAFEVFTQEIDLWWRHGSKYRIAGKRLGRLAFEPKLGGAVTETVEFGSGPKTFEVGKVRSWQPPHFFELEWRNVNFAPHEHTRVSVSFTQRGEGTMVRVEHCGWEAIRPDHPARHGKQGAAFCRDLGLWWAGLLTSLRQYVTMRDQHVD